MASWKYFLPFYLSLDKQNYARYGAFYIKVLENIEIHYPGLKDLIKEKGTSIQGQEHVKLRTATDQRGEQTLNRDAKITGGIKCFSDDEKSILKWTLNRSEQAKNTSELFKFSGLKDHAVTLKGLRPSQILKSESCVKEVIHVLKNEYINPFGGDIGKSELYNLSSGVPLHRSIAESILSVRKVGITKYDESEKSRLISKEKPFHDPIKRNKVKLFKDSTVKNTIKTKDKETIIEVNRNILGKLLSITASSEHNIDFQKVLEYPLSPIPLSLAHPDGSRRTCTKSKLTEIITKHSLQHQPSIYTGENVGTYIMDLMATLRTFNAIPETYELLTWRLFDMLPKGLIRINIVDDTYEGLSIKTAERSSRCISRSIIIQSPKSKIPSPFSDIKQ